MVTMSLVAICTTALNTELRSSCGGSGNILAVFTRTIRLLSIMHRVSSRLIL